MKTLEQFLEWLNGPEGGNSTARPWNCLEWAEALPDSAGPDFWKLMQAEWDCFDLIPHDKYQAQFERFKATAPGAGKDVPVTLYRGQCSSKPIGLSWTASWGVAVSFAVGHRLKFNQLPVVFEYSEFDPDEIAFTCDDRKEAEFVLLRSPYIKDLTATNWTKTSEATP